MDDVPVIELIEAWLGRPATRLDHRFPPALETIYAAETDIARRRAVRISSLAGFLTAMGLLPSVWRLLSDAHPLVRSVWIGIGLPISGLSHLLNYIRLPAIWQEAQVALAGVLVAICIAILLPGSAYGGTSLLLGSTVLILLLGLVGSRFPFLISALYTPAMLAVFVAGLRAMPAHGGAPDSVLIVLMGVICFYAAFGNWRLEGETRRSYALMLRARLGQQDLSSRNTELDALARIDALTGLANRRAYDGWMEAAWRQAQAEGTALTLILIDVDHFKLYNDLYGHPGGDGCLRAVAACLRDEMRGITECVARVGGEEFAVILPDLSMAACGEVAERLRRAVADLAMPHEGNGQTANARRSSGAARPDQGGIVTISLGVACAHPGDRKLAPMNGYEALVRAADQALYAAKQSGRNCVYLAGDSDAAALGEKRVRERRSG
jgi:diguanylate cyclase (GGDEF)-like protein